MKKKTRYPLADACRALAMISMVAYHACFMYFVLFRDDAAWSSRPAVFYWQQSICITFILLSGMVWHFGRQHALRRGLLLLVCGTIVTAVTYFLLPEVTIRYGILTFFGIATLLTIPYDHLVRVLSPAEKKNNTVHAFLCVLWIIVFLLLKHIPDGYLGTRFHRFVDLPDALYHFRVLAPIGFPPFDFFSADYFPIIPWLFLFFFGYHLGHILFSKKWFCRLAELHIPFLSALGTKSLLLYLLHAPLLYALLLLLSHI